MRPSRSPKTLARLALAAPLALASTLHAQAPVANPDSGSTCTGIPVTINVLANDSAPAGLQCGALFVTSPTPAGCGTVAIVNDPGCVNALCGTTCVRFIPSASFVGSATFTYTIRDTSNITVGTAVSVVVGNPVSTCGPGWTTRTVSVQDGYGTAGQTNSTWSSGVAGVPRLHIAKVPLGPGERLTQVDLRMVWVANGSLRIENTSTLSPCFAQMQWQSMARVRIPASIPMTCSPDLEATAVLDTPASLTPFDGAIDFSGSSGHSTMIEPQTFLQSRVLSQPAALATFVDSSPADGETEFLDFDHDAFWSSVAIGCGSMTFLNDAFSSITLVAEYRVCSPGAPFCAGDGSAAACPCGNTSAVGAQEGCRNSTGLGGALRASGVASITSDSLRLDASHLTGSTALFFQGSIQDSGGAGTLLGDGLRCVNGSIVRLGTSVVAGGDSRYPSGAAQLPIALRAGITTPGTRYYQVHYRNAAAFCTPATLNLTNGLRVDWQL